MVDMLILIGIAILIIVGAFALAHGGAHHSDEVSKSGLSENSGSSRDDGTVLTVPAVSSFSDTSSSCSSDSSSSSSSDSC